MKTIAIFRGAVIAMVLMGSPFNNASAGDLVLRQETPSDKVVYNWMHRYCELNDTDVSKLATLIDRDKYKGILTQLAASGPPKDEMDAVSRMAASEYDKAIAPAYKNPTSISGNPKVLAAMKAPTLKEYVKTQVVNYELAYKNRARLALLVLEKSPAEGPKER